MQNKWNVPPGMKDILPSQAARRRKIIQELMAEFEGWGYEEVASSSLEFYQVVQRDGMDPQEIFKIIDRDGQILALRPDVTTPIARMVASRLQDRALPLRLSYAGSAFRYENIQLGRQREFTQVGVELIGASQLSADIEVILLALKSIETAGIENFQIGLGEMNVTQGFITEMLEDAEVQEKAKNLLLDRNLVALEALVYDWAPADQARVFMSLIRNNGGPEVLDTIAGYSKRPAYQEAISRLSSIYQVLKDEGYGDQIFFDFSILRDFSYYTGLLFEGYAPGIGHPICGGGRYDRLVGEFGYDLPAVGFALGMERLLIAQGEERLPVKKDILLYGKNMSALLGKAQQLRAQDLIVEIDLTSASEEEARQLKEDKEIERLYVMEDDHEE